MKKNTNHIRYHSFQDNISNNDNNLTINQDKKKRFHYSPYFPPNNFFNEISYLKLPNKYNNSYMNNTLNSSKLTYDRYNERADEFIKEIEKKNTLSNIDNNNNYRYISSQRKFGDKNFDDICEKYNLNLTSNYSNVYDTYNFNYDNKYSYRNINNIKLSNVEKDNSKKDDYERLRAKYSTNYRSIEDEKKKEFNNSKERINDFNEEYHKRLLKHKDRKKGNLSDINNQTIEIKSGRKEKPNYKANYISKYNYNYNNNIQRKDYNQDNNYNKNFKKNCSQDNIFFTPQKERESINSLRRSDYIRSSSSKDNHSFLYSNNQSTSKKKEKKKPVLINYKANVNNYKTKKLQINEMKEPYNNIAFYENTYKNRRIYKESRLTNQQSNNFQKNVNIYNNYKKDEPKFRQEKRINTNESQNLQEYHYKIGKNFVNNSVNFATNSTNINKNKNNSNLIIQKEKRNKEEIDNKYRSNINKEYKIDTSYTDKNKVYNNKNSKNLIKEILYKADEIKNNENKNSSSYKKINFYYNKDDYIDSRRNSLNNSSNRGYKKETEPKYQREKLNISDKSINRNKYTTPASQKNSETNIKIYYNLDLNKKDNEYNKNIENKKKHIEKKLNYIFKNTKYNQVKRPQISEAYKNDKNYNDKMGYRFNDKIEKKDEDKNNLKKNYSYQIVFNNKESENINKVENKNNSPLHNKELINNNNESRKKIIISVVDSKNKQDKNQNISNNNYAKANNNINKNDDSANKNSMSNNNNQLNKYNKNKYSSDRNILQKNINNEQINIEKRVKSPEEVQYMTVKSRVLSTKSVFDNNQNINKNRIFNNDNIKVDYKQNNFVHKINNDKDKLIQDNKKIKRFDNVQKSKIQINYKAKPLNNSNNIKNNDNSKYSNNNNNANKEISIKNTFNKFDESKNNNNNYNNINKNSSLNKYSSSSIINNNYNTNSMNKNEIIIINNISNDVNNRNDKNNQSQKYYGRTNSTQNFKRRNEIIITKPFTNGLQNIGANYYLNSTLQCLAHIENLTKYLLKKKEEIKVNKNDYKLSYSYLEVLENLWENNEINDYSPNNFKEIICKMNPSFKGAKSNDSNDLIMFILENMHNELNQVKNVEQINKEKIDQFNFYNSLSCYKKYFNNNFKSIFSDIFYGIYNSQIKCLNCQMIIHNIQCYNSLIIPLEEVRKFKKKTQNTVTIKECLEYFQTPDYMSGQNQIYCNKCKQNANSVNSNSLILGPKVLIINLNREKGDKNETKLNFDEYIDINEFIYFKNTPSKYRVIGVITHFNGNFIAFCKSFVDNNWYKYNDITVNSSNFFEAKTTGVPCILFYSVVE